MTTAEIPELSRRIKWLVSILLCAHLLALVMPPLAFQTRGALGDSPSVQTLLSVVRHYAQFMYVDRGYAFFAPDPGPSHLIQAAITDASGNTVEKMIPSLDDQWPRLLYHRHFMLAEYLNEIYQPPNPPEEIARLDPVGAQLWAQSRARYEYVRQSVVDHLKHQNKGQRVVIRRVEHVLPGFIEMARDPIALNDPRLYRVLPDQALDPAQSNEAARRPPEAIPAPQALESLPAGTTPSSAAPPLNQGEVPPPIGNRVPPSADNEDKQGESNVASTSEVPS